MGPLPFDAAAADARRAKLSFDANALIAKAQRESRTDFTPEEQTAYTAIETELNDLFKKGRDHSFNKSFDVFKGEPGALDDLATIMRAHDGPGGRQVLKSLGAQFVDMKTGIGEWLAQTKGGKRPRHWSAPPVELKYNATLTSDQTATPYAVPTLIPMAQRPARVMDLIPQTPIQTNSVTTMTETAVTNGADAVAEGAPKPESSITFTKVTDPVRKIATWLPVSDEAVEDTPQLKGYIDGRLAMFVDMKTDDEILAGSGIDPHILGIMNRPGLSPSYAQLVTETAADAIAKQAATIAATQYLLPDAVVLNPLDWTSLQLMKTTSGEYLYGSPFVPPAGPMLWGLKVVQSPTMPVGTALVGAFGAAAMVFTHGGIKAELSNSHEDFFVRNLLCLLAERRLALSVIRSGAFAKVTALSFPVATP